MRPIPQSPFPSIVLSPREKSMTIEQKISSLHLNTSSSDYQQQRCQPDLSAGESRLPKSLISMFSPSFSPVPSVGSYQYSDDEENIILEEEEEEEENTLLNQSNYQKQIFIASPLNRQIHINNTKSLSNIELLSSSSSSSPCSSLKRVLSPIARRNINLQPSAQNLSIKYFSDSIGISKSANCSPILPRSSGINNNDNHHNVNNILYASSGSICKIDRDSNLPIGLNRSSRFAQLVSDNKNSFFNNNNNNNNNEDCKKNYNSRFSGFNEAETNHQKPLLGSSFNFNVPSRPSSVPPAPNSEKSMFTSSKNSSAAAEYDTYQQLVMNGLRVASSIVPSFEQYLELAHGSGNINNNIHITPSKVTTNTAEFSDQLFTPISRNNYALGTISTPSRSSYYSSPLHDNMSTVSPPLFYKNNNICRTNIKTQDTNHQFIYSNNENNITLSPPSSKITTTYNNEIEKQYNCILNNDYTSKPIISNIDMNVKNRSPTRFKKNSNQMLNSPSRNNIPRLIRQNPSPATSNSKKTLNSINGSSINNNNNNVETIRCEEEPIQTSLSPTKKSNSSFLIKKRSIDGPERKLSANGELNNTIICSPSKGGNKSKKNTIVEDERKNEHQQQQYSVSSSSISSSLLESFRNSPRQSRLTISEILGHLFQFSCDQHGSRLVQQSLEVATESEKTSIFNELLPNSQELMTDVFGNYVVQKLFDHISQKQCEQLALKMRGQVLKLSLQMYGCRVVQKALEVSSPKIQLIIVRELDGNVLDCVRDQNGNHVIQKAIERVSAQNVKFILQAFSGHLSELATHPYGCRVIQRIFEHCPISNLRNLLEELHEQSSVLIGDQYGNYVVQHVLEHGDPEDRARIMRKLNGKILKLSKHKFASNVIEKCLKCSSTIESQAIIAEILENDGSTLVAMIKDQYANYVVQKMLDVFDGEIRGLILSKMEPHVPMLKKFTYGKHLISKVEKLMNVAY